MDEFSRRQYAVCEKYCPNFTSLRHGFEKTAAAAPYFFAEGYGTAYFDFPLTYTRENFLARSLSSSYSLTPEDADYQNYAAALNDLTAGEDTITIANSTALLWGKVRA